jgi:hypothetical protein
MISTTIVNGGLGLILITTSTSQASMKLENDIAYLRIEVCALGETGIIEDTACQVLGM